MGRRGRRKMPARARAQMRSGRWCRRGRRLLDCGEEPAPWHPRPLPLRQCTDVGSGWRSGRNTLARLTRRRQQPASAAQAGSLCQASTDPVVAARPRAAAEGRGKWQNDSKFQQTIPAKTGSRAVSSVRKVAAARGCLSARADQAMRVNRHGDSGLPAPERAQPPWGPLRGRRGGSGRESPERKTEECVGISVKTCLMAPPHPLVLCLRAAGAAACLLAAAVAVLASEPHPLAAINVAAAQTASAPSVQVVLCNMRRPHTPRPSRDP